MKNKLPKKWINNLDNLDVAFQPILNIHTGKIFAVEALLRDFQDIGFKSIFSLFDSVYEENLLYTFDIALREKAFIKFNTIKNSQDIKLFYNLDNRLFQMPDFTTGNTNKILKKLNISKNNICFEVSERHEITSECNIEKSLEHYQNENFAIAIDDFGVGYSGYKLLYDSKPDFIKIDRFFIKGIENNIKKKLLVRNITHLAVQLGIKVIAEGVETAAEYLTCKDIGCHLVQGYLVQHPTKETKKILSEYSNIIEIIENSKRKKEGVSKIQTYLQITKPLKISTKMSSVIEYFKKNNTTNVIPVVNSNDEPLGILHESQIKEFLYSPYGMSLLLNDGPHKSKLKNLVNYCGNTDINSDISTIIELFSNNPESIGIIITKNSKYYGFLSARAIISIMNEENLILARDQNPLTKLPGNRVIEKYMSTSIEQGKKYLLCYFDLDNFKAFNDVYGFRNGDRIIVLFAQIMKKHLSETFFKAHIGGDDFFVAVHLSDKDESGFIKEIELIIEKFAQNAKEFYSKEDREKGYIRAKDREGCPKIYPLLNVSASIILINKNTKKRCSENINNILSIQKKVAKAEANHISISSLL